MSACIKRSNVVHLYDVAELNCAVFQKCLPSYFLEQLCQKLAKFNDFWFVKSRENLMCAPHLTNWPLYLSGVESNLFVTGPSSGAIAPGKICFGCALHFSGWAITFSSVVSLCVATCIR